MTAHRKAIFALALGLSTALSACDSVSRGGEITAPPAYGVGQSKKVATLLRTNVTFGGCIYAYVNPAGGTILYTTSTETVLSLTIPKSVVNSQTLFQICPTTNGTLGFDFTATDKNGPVTAFKRPLTLTISYSSAVNVHDASRLVIVYVVNSTPTESLGGTVDLARKTVTSSVFHFSTYVIGTD